MSMLRLSPLLRGKCAKQPATVAFEVIQFRHLDPPGQEAEGRDPYEHPDQRACPIDPPSIPFSGDDCRAEAAGRICAGPRYRRLNIHHDGVQERKQRGRIRARRSRFTQYTDSGDQEKGSNRRHQRDEARRSTAPVSGAEGATSFRLVTRDAASSLPPASSPSEASLYCVSSILPQAVPQPPSRRTPAQPIQTHRNHARCTHSSA